MRAPLAHAPSLSPAIPANFHPRHARAGTTRLVAGLATLFAAMLVLAPRALATNVSGNQSGTWTLANAPYIVTASVTVPAAQTLNIDPGVEVRVAPGQSIVVGGTLNANGVPGHTVILHADNPGVGRWTGLLLSSGGAASLAHTNIAEGGASGFALVDMSGAGTAASFQWLAGDCSNGASGGIRLTATSVTLDSLTVGTITGNGVNLTPTSPPTLGSITCTNCTGNAIMVNANPGSFPSGELVASGCGLNGVYVTGTLVGGVANRKATWGANPGCSYVVDALAMSSLDTLNLDPGAVVKFWSTSSYLDAGAGSVLRANGNAGSPVWFTSLKDDVHGGDTNGNGSANSPAAGDFRMLGMENTSRDSLNYTDVLYGGSGTDAAVGMLGGGLVTSLYWNTGIIQSSKNAGMRVNATTTTLIGLDANSNGAQGIWLPSPTNPPTLSNISCNNNTGIAIEIDANPGSFPGSSLSGSGNGTNGIYINGTLGAGAAGTYTWGANGTFPYVVNAVIVTGGDSLSISAGALVKFWTTSSYLDIGASSVLRSNGTAVSPVWFTSIHDDGHGGDTDGNGASTPAPGDFRMLGLESSSRDTLTYTNIAYGGSGVDATVGMLGGGSITSLSWSNGSIANSHNSGLRASTTAVNLASLNVNNNAGQGIWLPSPVNPPVLANLACSNNTGIAIEIDVNPGSLPGSSLSGSGNGTNGIYVNGTLGAGVAGTYSWGANANFPYVVNAVTITSADTLNIAPGAVIKFWTTSSYLDAAAASVLRANGTSGSPVWFTSVKDDAHGGDTNGNGGGNSPTPGDFRMLGLESTSRDTLAYTNISYGGSGVDATVGMLGGGSVTSLSWANGSITNSHNSGLRVTTVAVNLSSLNVSNNAGQGIWLPTPSIPPVLANLACNNNTGAAIEVDANPGSFQGSSLSGSGNGTNGIVISGTLGAGVAGTYAWGANTSFPYVVSAVVVGAMDSLNLAPGAVVKFSTAASYLDISGSAVLRCNGTAGSPVWLTSLKDDAHGGDTNGNGAGNSPAPGDFRMLGLESASRDTLTYTNVAYGGSGTDASVGMLGGGTVSSLAWSNGSITNSHNSGLRLTTTTVNLASLDVSGNAGQGIWLNAPATPPVLANLTCNNNTGTAIEVDANPGAFPGTLSGSGNGINGIYVSGTLGAGLAGTYTWANNPNFPYVVSAVVVNTSDTLVINAGTVVKFWNTSAYLQVNGGGVLNVNGTGNAPAGSREGAGVQALACAPIPGNAVWFTSLKDDGHGGDTNGNGGANGPAPGDFIGLDVENGSRASLNSLYLAYGGASTRAQLGISGGGTVTSLSWTGGGAVYGASRGISLTAASCSLIGLQISHNASDGAQLNVSGGAAVHNCNIEGNAGFGISNVAAACVDAISNWWGSPLGPTHSGASLCDTSGYNLGGSTISNRVLFRPYLTVPFNNTPPGGFALLLPAANSTVSASGVTLTWQRSLDLDGDPVTYDLELGLDSTFATTVIADTGLTDTSFAIHGVLAGGKRYFWCVVARDNRGGAVAASPPSQAFNVGSAAVGVGGDGAPLVFRIGRPTPNPALGSVRVAFSLPRAEHVSVVVYGASGRRVRILAASEYSAGDHTLTWDGRAANGQPAGAGIYFMRFIADSGEKVSKLALAR